MEQVAGFLVGYTAAMLVGHWEFTALMLLIGAKANRAWFIVAGALICTAVDAGLAALDSSVFLDPSWIRAAAQFLAALMAGAVGAGAAWLWRRTKPAAANG